MRNIGLHIRIPHTLSEAVAIVKELGIPIFQFFLIDQIARKPLIIDEETQTLFHQLKKTGPTPYVHGSYFMNLANINDRGKKTIVREIKQAKQLGASSIILHPGSATGGLSHAQGIKNLAEIINELTAAQPNITLVLENTAHGGNSIGSDLNDFKTLKPLLHDPSRIAYCIDTAHAHAYGYDLCTQEGREAFIDLVDHTMGLHHIALIHLNDSYHDVGSRIDKHTDLGKGTIGLEALRTFSLHPKLIHIPIILELPALSKKQEEHILKTVRQWHSKKEQL